MLLSDSRHGRLATGGNRVGVRGRGEKGLRVHRDQVGTWNALSHAQLGATAPAIQAGDVTRTGCEASLERGSLLREFRNGHSGVVAGRSR